MLRIYYDGLCHLCSAEISHYKKVVGHENLSFINIADPTFNASAEGLDSRAVNQFMHVKNDQGLIFTKVDAFIEIWKVLPGYRFAAKIAQLKILRPFLDLGYWTFATLIRPYLPKKKTCSI